jgi:hypothetical protein
LDVTNGAMILNRPTAFSFDPADPQVDEYYERIRLYCEEGQNPYNGGWRYYDGRQGIYSSTQAVYDNGMAWGIFDSRDPNNLVNYFSVGGSSTSGALVDGQYTSSIIVRATYLGDANLDGKVDDADFDAYWYGRQHPEKIGVVGDPNHPSAKWQFGDFNFDGVVDDSNDYQALMQGYLFQWDPLPVLVVGEPVVPEPGAWALMAVGAVMIVVRRLARRTGRRWRSR